MLKTCSKCLIQKELELFRQSYGKSTQPCRNCQSILQKEKRPLFRERFLINSKKYYQDNIEIIRAKHRLYAKTHRQTVNKAIKKYRLTHPDRYKASQKEYLKKNRHRFTAWENKRRAQLLKATPKWMTEKMLDTIALYHRFRPKGYELDHIVPLQGKLVSGLHVPWNLQYLKIRDNRSKKNKFEPCVINYVGGFPSPRT